MAARALVLFAHGARSPGWVKPFERLRDQVQAGLPGVAVSLAFLELMTPRLPEHVEALVASGVDDLTVVPVFLGQGSHVLRDLPAMLGTLRSAHPGLRIALAGAVGEDPAVLRAMADYCISAAAPSS